MQYMTGHQLCLISSGKPLGISLPPPSEQSTPPAEASTSTRNAQDGTAKAFELNEGLMKQTKWSVSRL